MINISNNNEVDVYISNYPPEVQKKLNTIRVIIKKSAPNATEKISWGMPTYTMNSNLIHFAGFKHHIGIYPGPEAIEHFNDKLVEYKTSKGAIQLPLDKEIPYKLIEELVEYREKMDLKNK